MATFTGGDAAELITPDTVSPSVVATAGARPSLDADSLNGGAGADSLDGGGGADSIDGGPGADLMLGGAGDDVLIWLPGGGSDSLDGGEGLDSLRFDTAGAAEVMSLVVAAQGHVSVTRDLGGIAMDIDNVERVAFGGGGGADSLTIGNLAGTDVRQVDIELGVAGAGDGQSDTVGLRGGASSDIVVLSQTGAAIAVSGLTAAVTLNRAEAADRLIVNLGAGADVFDGSALSGQVRITATGGSGDDALRGSRGDDVLMGELGNDVLIGGDGNDLLIGGSGADVFQFSAGSAGRDVVSDFQASTDAARGDVIVLLGFADRSFTEALANNHITQVGADVVISSAEGPLITLTNLSLASLHAGDILFG